MSCARSTKKLRRSQRLASLGLSSVAGAGVFVGLILGVSTADALSGTPMPPASRVFLADPTAMCQTASFGNFKLLAPEAPRSGSAAVDLPAGLVTITKAHSWDGYPTRVGHVQGSEIWEVEFLGASGSIVGVSAPTGDIADGVIEAHWNGALGAVTLSAPAVSVRAHHRPDLVAGGHKNSVHADKITVCFTTVPPTTLPATTIPLVTAPVTTVPATTTTPPTTTTPTTAVQPTTPTTAVPTTPVPPTTRPITTVPVAPTTAPPPSGPTITGPTPTRPGVPTTTPTSVEGITTMFVPTTAPEPMGPSLSQPSSSLPGAANPKVSQPALTDAVVPSPKTASFAYTGAETLSLAAAGGLAVAAGLFLLALRRKRTLTS